ncbi:MAG: hypothetical protein EBZ48_03180, partial [Proteobacteria bacterium]|nr:hypothetical protein [Pseudomonadota bacterium]
MGGGSFVSDELKQIRDAQRSFEERELHAARSLEGGARKNYAASMKARQEAGFFDDTTALQKMLDADHKMLHAREDKRKELTARLEESKKITSELEKIEGRSHEIQERLEKLTAAGGADPAFMLQLKNALEGLHRSEQGLQERAKGLLEGNTRLDTREYQKQMREVGEHLGEHVEFLNRTEEKLRLVQKAAVITAAAGVTVATAGAGSGLLVAAAVGTGAGTGVGLVANTTEAIGHVARGNKTVGDAALDAGKQTMKDAATAASTSALHFASSSSVMAPRC